ncbi:uncharacterized protein EI97DRAFT_444993 [Westerdykella ornata]|uniref:Transcriptional regulator Ngg1 n=1 Tax=Westerdykella ornata TaxID=318751 RepID=A0A6A6JA54_WESOR|nr:uncharacterized protein EI97DRAFT_444993 [Westerdykella ornata]KAF2273480.1 hypothetical protein EI97DRAFT_444993 [Westerdykella ornata]
MRGSAEPSTSSYLKSSLRNLSKDPDVTLDGVLERGGGGSQNLVPSGAALNSMRESIQKRCLDIIKQRTEDSDRLLRELQKIRRDHQRVERERDDIGERRHKLKKVKKREPDDDRPLAVGAHGVARQDGVEVHKGAASPAGSSPISQPPPSATGTGAADAPSPSESEASHQPAPVPSVPQFQIFGPDPSSFPDPTIYHIREVTPGMTEEEIKEIYSVAEYPQSDLHHLTPGTPPDSDFSNAKPASQVSATVFANYVEPYIRPLTEEDTAFLKERGDRVTPFIMPRRGARHYKEIWAEEDGAMHIDSNNDMRLAPNEPRGSYDDISEDVLGTELVSNGPLMSRLLSLLRPEGRGNPPNESNGANPDAMDVDEGAGAPADTNNNNSLTAATQIPEFLQPGWKAPPPAARTDYATLEERAMMEVKHYGLITDADEPQANYDMQFDDEVAARLRLLQDQLRKQSIVNGARKQRLLELMAERMAQQEYNIIADDLDHQLIQAYLKRNKNIGKSKKQTKRPGGPGGGSHPVPSAGVSRPGVGESIRALMERKSQWNNTIGPVVDYGKTSLPADTIFPEEKMKVLEDQEVEIWRNETEE